MQGRFFVRFLAIGVVTVLLAWFFIASGVFGAGTTDDVTPRVPSGQSGLYRLPSTPPPGVDRPAIYEPLNGHEADEGEAESSTESE